MSKSVEEEGVVITSYGDKMSKDLKVFYNPLMKLNRDMSLLVIKSYFQKQITFCDPMAASGIRELRFLKTISSSFKKLVVGDISKTAISNMKKNFKKNKITTKKIEFVQGHALSTMMENYFDVIEIDPFGSPVPFLDIACQKIKHNGILSVTATDTAALCGTYPKTCLRKYGIVVEKTHWYDELGLRNLIAYCQRQAAKYEKVLTPLISYTSDHYYKIFFKVEESRTQAHKMIKELKWIEWDKKTQKVRILETQTPKALGKTYVGSLVDKAFLKKVQSNLHLIEDQKKIEKLLTKLDEELDQVGYINPHKLMKEYKIASSIRYETLFEKVEKKGFKISRVHNNKYGVKTDYPYLRRLL